MTHSALEQRRLDEPVLDEEAQLLEMMATHEVAHLFNGIRRPAYVPSSPGDGTIVANTLFPPWIWLDKAIAVGLEAQLFPHHKNLLRHLTEWAAFPERPLDDEWDPYQAGQFGSYLRRITNDPAFLLRVWEHRNNSAQGPLTILEKMLRERDLIFCSPDPEVDDVFASGYCRRAFFPEPDAPEVYERFLGRAVAWHLRVDVQQRIETDPQTLDRLACRYYRLTGTSKVKALEVKIKATKVTPLKVELAVLHSAAMPPIEVIRFQRQGKLWTAKVPSTVLSISREWVLIVTNCDRRGNQAGSLSSLHEEGMEFVIESFGR